MIVHRGASGYRPEHTLAGYELAARLGAAVTGWFTGDFTLAELKTLTAVERLPHLRQNNTVFNGREGIPTFQEMLDLRVRLSGELRRELGVYPETKHPTFFQQAGLPLEPRLDTLRRNGLNRADAAVFMQSFEVCGITRGFPYRFPSVGNACGQGFFLFPALRQ